MGGEEDVQIEANDMEEREGKVKLVLLSRELYLLESWSDLDVEKKHGNVGGEEQVEVEVRG